MFRATIIGMATAAAFCGTAIAQDMPSVFDDAARLTVEVLAQHRGGSPDPTSAVDFGTTTNTGNQVTYNDVTINNTIGANTFVDSAGVMTVVQNAGSGVVIQTGVNVSVEMVQPVM